MRSSLRGRRLKDQELNGTGPAERALAVACRHGPIRFPCGHIPCVGSFRWEACRPDPAMPQRITYVAVARVREISRQNFWGPARHCHDTQVWDT